MNALTSGPEFSLGCLRAEVEQREPARPRVPLQGCTADEPARTEMNDTQIMLMMISSFIFGPSALATLVLVSAPGASTQLQFCPPS